MPKKLRKFVSNSVSRLDLFLSDEKKVATRSQVKRLIEEGNVKINGAVVIKPSRKIRQNDKIELTIPAPVSSKIKAQNIPLEIIYEDKKLIVINKSSGMIVHPAGRRRTETLVNALLYHCKDLSGIGGELKPGIVHRLDEGTSGAILVAKDDESHLFLSKQFQNREVSKTYLALVYGNPSDKGIVDCAIGRSVGDRKKFSSRTKKGRNALTEWKVKKHFGKDLALLEVTIHTGRTHQIRVHLTEKGFPLVGDPLYGRRKERRGIDEKLRQVISDFKRPALHAWKLGFKHPNGKKMKFTAEMPNDLKNIIDELVCSG